MVAPGQDQPGRHPNEALLLEALDEFDAVESTPLKLCRPSLQKSQDDIRGSIGDGSRLDLNEEIVSTASDVSKGVRLGGGHRAGNHQEGGRSVFPSSTEVSDDVVRELRVELNKAFTALFILDLRQLLTYDLGFGGVAAVTNSAICRQEKVPAVRSSRTSSDTSSSGTSGSIGDSNYIKQHHRQLKGIKGAGATSG